MRKDIEERKEEILVWIEEKLSNKEIAKRLVCKVDTLKSYYKKWNVDYSGNKGYNTTGGTNKKSYEEIKDHGTSHRIRLKLLSEGLKEHKCEICGLKKWNGELIPLELHHLDGNHCNNELSNLQVVCPNCHALTDTYSCKK